MSDTEAPSSQYAKREKLILSGLYLSKFDSLALARLGFDGFTEAFNVIGYALGTKPATIKNYRDEFDPHFPNRRAGWHRRPIRKYCREIYNKYKELDLDTFTLLMKAIVNDREMEGGSEGEPDGGTAEGFSAFARRLVTGQAAENYFQSIHSGIPEFSGRTLENTTQLGCGYDFRLRAEAGDEDFLAVEVKGLTEISGGVSMTMKEFGVARMLRGRFYLFVVKNFREIPYHVMFRDPTSCGLEFKRAERVIVQVSWSTIV